MLKEQVRQPKSWIKVDPDWSEALEDWQSLYYDYLIREDNGVPNDVKNDVALFKYRQAFNLSGRQMADEPETSIDEAFFMWDLQAARVRLESERRQSS